MAVPKMACPAGGRFYACSNGSRFVGCCSTDPCGSNSCPAGNLLVTSFDPVGYDNFVDQQCSGGLFFTCAHNSPPFWGCCKSDPCATGQCSVSDIAGAYLSSNPTDAAPFIALNDTVGSSTFLTSKATSTIHSTTMSSPSSSPASTVSRSPNHIGAIVGGAVGGFAVIAALLFSLLWLVHRRRNSEIGREATVDARQPDDSPDSVNYPPGISPYSPTIPTYPVSPELHVPSSPQLPLYVNKRLETHDSQELPGSPVGQELESGQRFHPYKLQ